MRYVGTAAHYKDFDSKRVLRQEPAQGTELRRVYDLFVANPCLPMTVSRVGTKGFTMVWEKIQDYGLDVRRHSRGVYWLVGRHTEAGYRDYLAERVSGDPQTDERVPRPA